MCSYTTACTVHMHMSGQDRLGRLTEVRHLPQVASGHACKATLPACLGAYCCEQRGPAMRMPTLPACVNWSPHTSLYPSPAGTQKGPVACRSWTSGACHKSMRHMHTHHAWQGVVACSGPGAKPPTPPPLGRLPAQPGLYCAVWPDTPGLMVVVMWQGEGTGNGPKIPAAQHASHPLHDKKSCRPLEAARSGIRLAGAAVAAPAAPGAGGRRRPGVGPAPAGWAG